MRLCSADCVVCLDRTAAILFKFARDPFINGTEYLYGGTKPDEEASRKAMGNELKVRERGGAKDEASVFVCEYASLCLGLCSAVSMFFDVSLRPLGRCTRLPTARFCKVPFSLARLLSIYVTCWVNGS